MSENTAKARIKIIERFIEATTGEPAPFEFSRLIARVKKDIPDFQEQANWEKSSELADFLEKYDLIKQVYPKGELIIYIQPLVSLKDWIPTLREHLLEEYPRRLLLDADAINLPLTSFHTLSSFLDFIDDHEEEPIFRGSVVNHIDHSFWLEKNGVCYAINRFDADSIAQLREMVTFGLDGYQGDINSFTWEPLSILHEKHEKVRQNLAAFSSMPNYQEYLPDEIEITIDGSNPYEIYRQLKDLGFEHINEYEKVRQLGLATKKHLESYDRLSDQFDQDDDYLSAMVISNFYTPDKFEEALEMGYVFYQEYEDALKGKFDNAEEFRAARQKGFKQADIYREAMEKGFKNREAYEEAQSGGFLSKDEMDTATSKGFETRETWLEARELELDDYNDYERYVATRDERIEEIKPALLQVIDFMRDGSHSIQSIQEFVIGRLRKEVSRSDIHYLLSNDDEFNEYGYYDVEIRGYHKGSRKPDFIPQFASNNGNGADVIVDASNVAWHGKRADLGEKPKFENILIMINALKRRNIENPLILAKSNLKHIIDNKQGFSKLIEDKIVKETPASEDDDEYILKIALRRKLLIISNDLFRDWQRENPDLAEKIQELTTQYSITSDQVDFSEQLDGWIRNPKNQ